jgi:hypothetical protein
MVTHFVSWLVVVLQNIGLGWKSYYGKNTLAYISEFKIAREKSFIIMTHVL